jgi:CubicO group peptidase (beta-lactamase class C family)
MNPSTPINGDGASEVAGIDELVTSFLRDNLVAGATVAASKHGRLIWSKAYGFSNAAEQRPLLPTHRSRVGSVSKLFTTAATLKLIEEGRLSLTTPVYTIHVGDSLARHGLTGAEYQAEFDRNRGDGFRLVQVSGYGEGSATRFAAIWVRDLSVETGVLRDRAYTQALIARVKDDAEIPVDKVEAETRKLLAWAKSLQVRHLLSHTSGFIRDGNRQRSAERLGIPVADMTYREAHLGVLLGAVSKDGPFVFAPGTDHRYSNHGFGLAGYIVSQVAGVPYTDYVREHLLAPVGLNHVVPYGTALGSRDALRHTLENGTPTPIPHAIEEGEDLGAAAGGWAATAHDLVTFMCALDKLAPIADILDAGTIEVMETVAFPQLDGE